MKKLHEPRHYISCNDCDCHDDDDDDDDDDSDDDDDVDALRFKGRRALAPHDKSWSMPEKNSKREGTLVNKLMT